MNDTGNDNSQENQIRLASLRAEIAVGLKQAEAGDFVEFTGEEIITEGCAKRAARNARGSDDP